MLIYFSFRLWYFPFVMSIFYFGQMYCGCSLYFFSLCLIPILQAFFLLFAIILEGIYYFFNKNKQQQRQQTLIKLTIGKIDFIENSFLANKKMTVGFGILLAILFAFENGTFYEVAYLQSYGFSSSQSFLGMLITWSASHYLFQMKLYRHHILGLALIGVVTVIHYSIDFEFLQTKIIFVFIDVRKFYVFLPIYLITSSLKEVLEHYLMHAKYVPPSLLLFYEGVSSMIIYAIYMAIIEAIPCDSVLNSFFSEICLKSKWSQFVKDFVKIFFDPKLSVYGSFFIICGFIMNYFRIQTNKLLSPTHRYMAEIVFVFYWFLYDVGMHYLNKSSKRYNTLSYLVIERGVISVILIIPVLIFNEYLIIKVCKLHKNTHSEIDKRAETEMNITIQLREELENLRGIDNINNEEEENENEGEVIELEY